MTTATLPAQRDRDAIRERVDIVDVVSEYVALSRAGQNLKGLCPFHAEKTPSFNVSPSKQVFYCFGCGAGGDMFTFLMKIEAMSFPEAVEVLAERVGLSANSTRFEHRSAPIVRPPLHDWRRISSDLLFASEGLWLRSDRVFAAAERLDTSRWNQAELDQAMAAVSRAHEDRDRADLLEDVAFGLRMRSLEQEQREANGHRTGKTDRP